MLLSNSSSQAIDLLWLYIVVLGTFVVAAAGYVGLCIYFAIRADSADRRVTTQESIAPDARTAPFSWLVPAAIATVLAFTPCAIASLVHASRVAPHFR